MEYAKVLGDELLKYPYDFSALQQDNPYTNFGDNYDVAFWFPQTNSALIDDQSLMDVIIAPMPTYDPNNEICSQNENPTLINGVWTLGWTVSTMTPDQKYEHDQQVKAQNKNQATQLLNNTDWAAIPSVADPAQSNPYLANQTAFLQYRSQVREIAVNPPVIPVTDWPILPKEIWVTT